jgi:hypothetical protein
MIQFPFILLKILLVLCFPFQWGNFQFSSFHRISEFWSYKVNGEMAPETKKEGKNS